MLFAALILGSAVVFVAHGYRYEIGTGYLAKTADPTVSYEDYSKMTKKRDRTAAFAKETTYNKSLLWKQHFAYYEVKLDLNHRQKEFLRRVSAFLEESFFTHPINMSEAEYLKTTRGKPF